MNVSAASVWTPRFVWWAGPVSAGLSRKWGLRRLGRWRVWVGNRFKELADCRAECAVVDGAADLQQQVGPASGQRTCCDLAMRRLTRKLAVPSVIEVPAGSVRILVEEPLHHRGVQIGSYLHNQSILKSNDPTVSVVEPHSVSSCGH